MLPNDIPFGITLTIQCAACGADIVRPAYKVAHQRQNFCNRACRAKGVTRTVEERFWEKVNKTNDCWLWTGSKSKAGYGTFNLGPRGSGHALAHRFSYEALRGPIPIGLHLDHLCRVPACVNPDHLEAVTPRVNALRGNAPHIALHQLGVCKRGHPVNEENTYIIPRTGRPQCRVCRRLRRSGISKSDD